MCTVHSFPHNTDHCVTSVRSEFEGLLEKTQVEGNAYLSNPSDCSKLKDRFIAGRIIPTITTSTEMAIELVYMELWRAQDGGLPQHIRRLSFACIPHGRTCTSYGD
ncbi:hypothetical protein MLD38_005960 [Melastoma candidum]|uniref:Uncharacterized protein n=1 Tax=Melastoma candidum TaxID=119954 RepID=A0ACB9RML1_9MYRT|nr:hypothetical protein MLD38_005960 [Melastoma candidum]